MNAQHFRLDENRETGGRFPVLETVQRNGATWLKLDIGIGTGRVMPVYQKQTTEQTEQIKQPKETKTMNDRNGKIKLTEAEFKQLSAESAYLRRIKDQQDALAAAEKRTKERIALLKDAIIERNEGSKTILPGIIVAETVKMDYDESEAFEFVKGQPELWSQYFKLAKTAHLALMPFVLVHSLRVNEFYELDKRAYEANVGRGALPDAPKYTTSIEDQVRISVSSLLLHDELREAVQIVEDTQAPESVESTTPDGEPEETPKTSENGAQGEIQGIPTNGKASTQTEQLTFLSDEEKAQAKDEAEAQALEDVKKAASSDEVPF